ncbi:hypothetical protein [Demequina zhanjiangensis]|uniref:Uncharacterized protein n=1 Tax=Demequina zhanjiangensis TaxID=3051659 RepID=A0ABT8FZ06_9MICO|nr:hypothetical protein [Demequina sp. SYSU T00b26]MDN4472118.1 hypothetical protein [Demequina sp. SYSU T00b26]
MTVPRRMSVVHRTTMRAVALGAAAGLSVGGATAAAAAPEESSDDAPATTQSIQIVDQDDVVDDQA